MKKLTSLFAALAWSLGALATSTMAQAADQDLVARGQYLARAGDCMACHSAAGKPAYSGGLAIDSGHGVIYSTNITPDKEHGIGNYSEAQFSAAVRHGVRADGTQLYPAMPYPSYAKVSDEDIHALYTYFMQGVQPVASTPPASSMSFPFNIRWGMKLWNVFFANDKPFREQDGWSAEIKRGAYLVEGLGHCGSCHTPRGFAMNEKASDSSQAQFLSGGDLNGWAVPSLRGMPHWSAQDIVDYLQTGRNKTASVAGEMSLVVEHSTSHLKREDLQAMAAYLKTLSPVASSGSGRVIPQGVDATVSKLTAAKDLTLGERLYLDNCAACHFVNGRGAPGIFPVLDGATVVNAENPSALLHVILAGARTPSTEKAPSILVMPGFAHRLSDEEAAALATFVRQGWGNHAGKVSEREVGKLRAGMDKQH
ncbi:c-type cytochrome [Herbaspirillum seropedicae]|uniref:cytochrome c n=1 Tax=Herbaspirillum seropedicae TaxID=964 RepID=UPI0011214155|nr:cytochrome c [Herbaspirillum seropedicae]QDD66778.1 c-type cytochrome [Herbaspirillum seropedicae]